MSSTSRGQHGGQGEGEKAKVLGLDVGRPFFLILVHNPCHTHQDEKEDEAKEDWEWCQTAQTESERQAQHSKCGQEHVEGDMGTWLK